MIFYSMFLYTSFEILLYVVSIFNTSADVKSFYLHPDFSTLRSFSFHSDFSGSLIFSTAKVSYITGTSICRTTDILIRN